MFSKKNLKKNICKPHNLNKHVSFNNILQKQIKTIRKLTFSVMAKIKRPEKQCDGDEITPKLQKYADFYEESIEIT